MRAVHDDGALSAVLNARPFCGKGTTRGSISHQSMIEINESRAASLPRAATEQGEEGLSSVVQHAIEHSKPRIRSGLL
ncbi:hypothetical protein BKA81DRAFT_82583 [Phyllosticta paracitricarpa]